MLFVLFLLARRVVHSPFGLSLRAIRNNPLRASAIGIPVNRRLIAIYSLAAFYAGVAGALSTQSTALASLDVFAFDRSADLLLVLVIGGTGYLYGGLIGAVVFKLLQELFSTLTPQYWQFWIGLVLVIIVLIGRERMQRWALWLPRKIGGCRSPRGDRRTEGDAHDLGAADHRPGETVRRARGDPRSVARRSRTGARHALIGPNGAGKTTVINLLTGVLKPNAGTILLHGQDITTLPVHSARAARAVAHLPDQPALCRSDAAARRWGSRCPNISATAATGGGGWALAPTSMTRSPTSSPLSSARRDERARPADCPTASSGCWRSRWRSRRGHGCCCSTSRPPACRKASATISSPRSPTLPRDVTVLLIEHDMDLVFSFADRISVLVDGAMLVEGTPEEVARDPRVKAVYLGEGADG